MIPSQLLSSQILMLSINLNENNQIRIRVPSLGQADDQGGSSYGGANKGGVTTPQISHIV